MDSFLLGVAGKHPGTRSPGELLLVSRERLASRGLVGTEELSGFLQAGGSSLGERGEHCGGCTRNGGLGPGGHIVSVEHGNRLPHRPGRIVLPSPGGRPSMAAQW